MHGRNEYPAKSFLWAVRSLLEGPLLHACHGAAAIRRQATPDVAWMLQQPSITPGSRGRTGPVHRRGPPARRVEDARYPDSQVPDPTASQPEPPHELSELARQRSAARAARRWQEADRLRERIEAAGWRPVDSGTRSVLVPIHPPDVIDAGIIRYGSSGRVPSRLHEPDGTDLSVIVIVDLEAPPTGGAGPGGSAPPGSHIALAAPAAPAALAALAALAATIDRLPPGSQAVAVLNAERSVSPALLEEAFSGPGAGIERIWSSSRLPVGCTLEMGLRRCVGATVAWLPDDMLRTGVSVAPLHRALDDPAVAVVGSRGLQTRDLCHFEPAPAGRVDALGRGALAFRRAEAAQRVPVDEAFLTADGLSIWWSLRLRDRGDAAPGHALCLEVPQAGIEAPVGPWPPPERDRSARRDAYRLLGHFGQRKDLLLRA